MTVYNKLKLAILAIVASQNIYAINVDPVQISLHLGNCFMRK